MNRRLTHVFAGVLLSVILCSGAFVSDRKFELLVMAGDRSGNVTCPIDDSPAYWTGKSKTDKSSGKLLWLYKCTQNRHEFWVVQQ